MHRWLAVAACAMMVSATGCQTVQFVSFLPGMIAGGPFPDECSSMHGYAEFRSRLAEAVARKDEAAFRALFAADGVVRSDDISGGLGAPTWHMDGAGAGAWADLEEILGLGCAVQSDGDWLLPYTADVQSPTDQTLSIVVRRAPVRSAPAEGAAVLTTLPRGAVLMQRDDAPAHVDGWGYYTLTDGRAGYMKDEDTRSTLETAVQVKLEGDERRIAYYGGYD